MRGQLVKDMYAPKPSGYKMKTPTIAMAGAMSAYAARASRRARVRDRLAGFAEKDRGPPRNGTTCTGDMGFGTLSTSLPAGPGRHPLKTHSIVEKNSAAAPPPKGRSATAPAG